MRKTAQDAGGNDGDSMSNRWLLEMVLGEVLEWMEVHAVEDYAAWEGATVDDLPAIMQEILAKSENDSAKYMRGLFDSGER